MGPLYTPFQPILQNPLREEGSILRANVTTLNLEWLRGKGLRASVIF